MAVIGSISGSKYIGTPITVPVTAATISGNPTFHRVRLVVIINSTQQFPMSRPVAEGETIEFDISSAFRAVADAYQYQADRLNPATGDTYPQFTCRLQAYDDYLLDGEEHTIGPSQAVDKAQLVTVGRGGYGVVGSGGWGAGGDGKGGYVL